MSLFRNPYDELDVIPNRKPGYYKVKLTETSFYEAAFWSGKMWYRCGTQYTNSDGNFFFIDDKPLF